MSAAFNVNWSYVVIVLGTMGLSALTLILIFNAVIAPDAWSKRLPTRLDARIRRALRREVESEESNSGVCICPRPNRWRTLRRGYADRRRLVWPADERHPPMPAWSY